jgi:hypothetical protein
MATLSEPDRASLRGSFRTVQQRITHLLDYALSVIPTIREHPKYTPELAESLVLLLAVRLEAFFVQVVSLGTRHREQAVRRHFAKNGLMEARTSTLPALVTMVRRRVSFEKKGKRLDGLFRLIFRRSVWASPEVRDVILDLVLLRNFIVHGDGADWSQQDAVLAAYATQFRVADVLTVKKYGEFAVYRIDHYKALVFVKGATLALVDQLKYLEQHVANDLTWAEEPP